MSVPFILLQPGHYTVSIIIFCPYIRNLVLEKAKTKILRGKVHDAVNRETAGFE